MKKKIEIVLLAMSFMLLVNGQNYAVWADETVKVAATQAEGEPGDIVEITFFVTDNPGTTMYEMKIGYESDVLKVVSIEDGKYYPEWFETDVTIVPLYISAGDPLSLTNLTENCDLVTVHFEISNQAEKGKYYFSVEDGLFLNGELYEYKVNYDNSGCITVKDESVQSGTQKEKDSSENIEHKKNNGQIEGQEENQSNSQASKIEKNNEKMDGSEEVEEKENILDEKFYEQSQKNDEKKDSKENMVAKWLIAAIVLVIFGGCAVKLLKKKKYSLHDL